ncbi:YbaY family lipoprotein [Chlorobium phaeobacteroides]|jgi:putative lipoprotein|uniref:Uncharacterized protein n=1 Tax=Chlorobium phaeobacteroides (strain DSM 266 / SMG 266 / 2430) TaxID=290317 RepID=A1BCJ7_CHLPD|nr:YbaY family lipoprotein [Chlorobium phaeobacteroides]ABL64124.1 hypothetical protein Cpha266_0054 [Chlorobium phaeobacteroides DSM 266]MBV5330430.1 YbaY family lipoprotein [Chlorobium sp.]
MIVSYILSLSEPLSLPSTALLRIEIRDTSLADAPSVTLAETQQTAEQVSGKTVVDGAIDLQKSFSPKATITLWAHLSLSGEKRIKKEDFITTRSYPITTIDENGQVLAELHPVSR